MGKKNISEMRKIAERWAANFNRVVLNTDETEGGNLILTMQKGTQLDSDELTWLIKKFNNVIIETVSEHLHIWLF